MRVVRIDRWELKDFGSHRHTVLEPGDARLIVIQGENGVGKTTLASEALGHALFKDDRGSINAGVRNGATESAVSIDFAFAGQHYRAIRRRTIRAGGKSSADLQVRTPEGTWAPVASGDKEVPAAVRELLRMDKDTFRTSVSLAQKDLDRFVAAKASGRKEVLASIVVDPRFAPAAKLASKAAGELEAATRIERDQVARLDDTIAELAPMAEILEGRRADAAAIAVETTATVSARTDAEDRLRELETALAAAAGTADEIARVEAEVAGLAGRYRETQARRTTATGAIERARLAIEAGAGAAAAAKDLPWQQGEVARLEALRDQDAELEARIRTRREAHALASATIREEVAAWTAGYESARTRVDELTAAMGALVPIPCPKCGTEVSPGREDLAARLGAASNEYRRLEGSKPKEPLFLATEAAQLVRLEDRRRELGHAPATLEAITRDLRRLEVLAAAARSVADAEYATAEAQAAIAAADAELAAISEAGHAARGRLETLNAAQAALADTGRERDAAMVEITRLRVEIDELEGRARFTAVQVARLEGEVARLEQLRADRAAHVAALAATDIELGRLRKLAAAYGLKGIPARVIESVLPELSAHANDVLGQLFGMSLEIRAQRATADGKGIVEALDLVIRKDGTGELELERISGGQETAVSLALAIGLSRLNARRAGTAIRTLVLDEPDGLDVRRLRALGQALRTLAHTGELERVVVITHTAELAEFGDLVVDLREGPDGVEMFIDGLRVDPDEAAAIAA